MQEMQPPNPVAPPLKEYFTGLTAHDVKARMNNRRRELEVRGYTFVRRRKIGRNEPCACGSGVKFKLCHINNLEALNAKGQS